MAELEREYRRASYIVDAPGSSITLRVGEPSAEFDDVLQSLDATTWAFITAHNPHSQIRSPEENRGRHRTLLELASLRGLQSLPSAGVDDDGTWPTESGRLLLDVRRDDAITMGRELEQNAILFGERGGAPELVYCFESS